MLNNLLMLSQNLFNMLGYYYLNIYDKITGIASIIALLLILIIKIVKIKYCIINNYFKT
jgi:hypothetical protein